METGPIITDILQQQYFLMTQKSIKILIVDDRKEFLVMIVELMRSVQKNLRIMTARSGKECLRTVKEFTPNLVFLDIGMDGMNGLVTLRFIKSMDKNARVFFLSGHPVEFIRDAAGIVKADGYYTKTAFIDLLKTKQTLDEILQEGISHE